MRRQGKTLRKLPVFLCLAFLLVGEVASAVIVNGGFEAGDFTGWETMTGQYCQSTYIKTSSFGIGPTEGYYQALVTNGGDAIQELGFTGISPSAIETFVGLPQDILAELQRQSTPAYYVDAEGEIYPVLAPPVDGSAIKQTFGAKAGDVLSFEWNFLTSTPEGQGYLGPGFFAMYNDFTFVSIVSDTSLAVS